MPSEIPPQFPELIEHLQEHGWEVDASGEGLPPRRAEIRAVRGELEVVVDARLSVRSQAKLGLPPVWKSKSMNYYVRHEGPWWELRGPQAFRDLVRHQDPELADIKRQSLPFRELMARRAQG